MNWEPIRSRPPGTLPAEAYETELRAAILQAKEEGLMIVSGTFGSEGVSCDPVAAIGRWHADYSSKARALHGAGIFGCEILGWNHDQMWAFIAGFDGYSKGVYFADPRALRHPELVALGQKLRGEFVGGP